MLIMRVRTNRWDSSVRVDLRVDLKEPGVLPLVLGHIDAVNPMRILELLQQDLQMVMMC
jgi:hypothetical protein